MIKSPELENVVLQESYVVDISGAEKGVAFLMEFLLKNGQTAVGRLIFPDVEAQAWLNTKGDLQTLNDLIASAHRYYGSRDERPDLGTINSITYDGECWAVSGDWGSCRLRSPTTPKVVVDEDSLAASGPLSKS